MEPEGSLLCSQEPSTGLYPEPEFIGYYRCETFKSFETTATGYVQLVKSKTLNTKKKKKTKLRGL
jgi:hypothetical protein